MNDYIKKEKVIDILYDKYLVPETKIKRIEELSGVKLLNCGECVNFEIKGDVTHYGYCTMWNYPIDHFGFCHLARKR